jgi:hypothetical protein
LGIGGIDDSHDGITVLSNRWACILTLREHVAQRWLIVSPEATQVIAG